VAKPDMSAARLAKKDEFYTQFSDIEKEMNAYLEYDENVFRNKTVLLHAMTQSGAILQSTLHRTSRSSA